MAVFRCKTCGAPLDVKKADEIITCNYCGMQQTTVRLKKVKLSKSKSDKIQRNKDAIQNVDAQNLKCKEENTQCNIRINKKAAQIVAWSVAGVVLVGALGYYNFVDKPLESGVAVGNICPDFTVQTYKKEDGKHAVGGEDFTLSDFGGKIVIVNFWATYCGPCIAELPEFDQFQKDHPEDVQVIALDGELSESYDSLCEWINTNEKSAAWKDFDIAFGWYDAEENNVYNTLGFTSGMLPGTMIVNREGVIVYSQDGSMHYEDLERIVGPYLKY